LKCGEACQRERNSKNRLINDMKRFFLNKMENQKKEIKELPFIIELINDSNEIKDADIFGSAEYIPKLNYDGNFDKEGLKISNGVHNTNYLSLLSAVWKQSIKTENILITLIEGDAVQLNQIIAHIYSHPNGNKKEKVCYPYKDPYQNQFDITRITDKLEIDFLTKLTLQVMPKTHLRFTIFYQNA
jgi:hypothetical protein